MSTQPSLAELRERALGSFGTIVDASIGSPVDPPPSFVPHALACQGAERGYPPAAGVDVLLDAARDWFERRWQVRLADGELAPTAGSKEAIGTLTWLLAQRRPTRRVVLVPEVAYPTYAAGAEAAGLEVVRVPEGDGGAPDFDAVDASTWRRALVSWVNAPSNPTGAVYDLAPIVERARRSGVVLVSDEAYGDFVWQGEARSALVHGSKGVLALFSLSKRSNLAGLRVGLVAGDAELVAELIDIRRRLGLLAAGPSQVVAAETLRDEAHVLEQRERYRHRLGRLARVLERFLEAPVALPAGGIYLWVKAPGGDGAALARRLADELGLVVAPGADYGDPRRVRVAATVKDAGVELLEQRGGLR